MIDNDSMRWTYSLQRRLEAQNPGLESWCPRRVPRISPIYLRGLLILANMKSSTMRLWHLPTRAIPRQPHATHPLGCIYFAILPSYCQMLHPVLRAVMSPRLYAAISHRAAAPNCCVPSSSANGPRGVSHASTPVSEEESHVSNPSQQNG